MPHGIDIDLVELEDVGSEITVTIDVDKWNITNTGFVSFETTSGLLPLEGDLLPLNISELLGGAVTYKGEIVSKPSVDGETTVTVYFPENQVWIYGTSEHVYIQKEVFS